MGVVNQARILGGTIGLACSTIILNIRFGEDLGTELSVTELKTLRGTLDVISSFSTDKQIAVQRAFARAFNDQMRICAYVAAGCLILGVLTYKRHPINFKRRLELGAAVMDGSLTCTEADEKLRARD